MLGHGPGPAGESRTALNAVAAFTCLAGIAAFAIGIVVKAHLIATILGIAVFAVGMIAQMLSQTREQRIIIVTGIIAAAVGAGLGIAHGGFG